VAQQQNSRCRALRAVGRSPSWARPSSLRFYQAMNVGFLERISAPPRSAVGRLGPDAWTTQDTATCRRRSAKRDVNFHSINEPSCGFPPYFPRISPLRSCAIRENLPDMNLGHSKRQETAKRSHELRQVVRDHASGLSDRVVLERMRASDEARAVDVALCEKPYELPSPTIWSAKNFVICRLLSNFKSGLTVKIRNRMTKKFLPSDLPSIRFAWWR